ncbi:hypothetical protein SDC9_111270 [bioreactor metagenome]|uniref:Metallo-beta-lactamase domain-containing protein n=2 Tax=root TaxID=1 RepID=A0A645BRE0_9ZZZZ
MEEILKETQYNEMHIKFIILSHAHFDHLGISAELQEKFRIPCYVHINDKRMLMHADMYAQRFAGCRVKIPKEISFYDSDKLFVFGEESFSVIHTPGHSEGGVCIIFNNFIFTGDTLLFESIGRTDLPTGNMKHLSQSIKKIFELSSDHMLIFPGHGGNWSIYEAKKWWNENKHIYINNSLGFD